MPTFSHLEPTESECPSVEDGAGTAQTLGQIIEGLAGAPLEATPAYAKRLWLALDKSEGVDR